MKKLFLFLFFIPLTLALTMHGGETIELASIKCDGNYTVKVTGTNNIDTGEYQILNCTNNNHTWSCHCSDSLLLKLHTGAFNNYTLHIKYYYLGEEYIDKYSSSSGGYMLDKKEEIILDEPDEDEHKEDIIEIEEELNEIIKADKEDFIEEKKVENVEKDEKKPINIKRIALVSVLSIVTVVSCFRYFKIRNKKKNIKK